MLPVTFQAEWWIGEFFRFHFLFVSRCSHRWHTNRSLRVEVAMSISYFAKESLDVKYNYRESHDHDKHEMKRLNLPNCGRAGSFRKHWKNSSTPQLLRFIMLKKMKLWNIKHYLPASGESNSTLAMPRREIDIGIAVGVSTNATLLYTNKLKLWISIPYTSQKSIFSFTH